MKNGANWLKSFLMCLEVPPYLRCCIRNQLEVLTQPSQPEFKNPNQPAFFQSGVQAANELYYFGFCQETWSREIMHFLKKLSKINWSGFHSYLDKSSKKNWKSSKKSSALGSLRMCIMATSHSIQTRSYTNLELLNFYSVKETLSKASTKTQQRADSSSFPSIEKARIESWNGIN